MIISIKFDMNNEDDVAEYNSYLALKHYRQTVIDFEHHLKISKDKAKNSVGFDTPSFYEVVESYYNIKSDAFTVID